MSSQRPSMDPLHSNPTKPDKRQQANSPLPPEVPDIPRTLVDQSYLSPPTTGSQTSYQNSEQLEGDSNIDLEKGPQEHPVQDASINNNNNHSTLKDDEDDKDPNLIGWDGPDDPNNPHNWSFMKRARITIALGVMTLAVTFASSVFSTGTEQVSKEFSVSTEVATLGTSLFILGFATGPVVWGPGSELIGRTIPLFFGYGVFVIFQVPVAVAQNLQTIMICRFLGGVFAAAPVAIGGAILADIWDPVDRGVAICVWSGAIFIGPTLGPIIGGFITKSYLGWRWTAYITLFLGAFLGCVGLIFIPETYAPVLLSRKAKKLRFETKNWAIHSKHDESEVNVKVILENYLLRPFKMLIQEPILLLITIYISLIYGILYLFFEAYPITFQEQRGFNAGVGALPFIAIMIGAVLGSISISIMTKTRFARKLKENNGKVVPEERLPAMIAGSILLPAGLFWFGWTSSPNISWVPQTLAGIPIGWGIIMVFLQGFNYIIDVYLQYAASAIAANTIVRSCFGAGFPLFATQMFHNLGVPWASSTLAFLCMALIPAPICFFIFGEKLRRLSRFSPTA